MDILEGPATAQAQEGCADSVGTGSIETPATLELKKRIKNGLVHGNGPHFIKGPLGTNDLKEGVAGTAGEQPLPGLNHGKTVGAAGEQPPRGLNHRNAKKELIVIRR
jgi:hypothetical protein